MITKILQIIVPALVLSIVVYGQKTEELKNAKPLYGFIENKGQIKDQNNNPNDDVKFILPLPNNNIVLRSNGFSYDTYIIEENGHPRTDHQVDNKINDIGKNITYKFHRVDVEFVGADSNTSIIPEERSEDYINYYMTSEEGIKVFHYRKVIYKDIYPGIDVEYIARPGKRKPIEYNFIVHAGADISDIKLRYVGASASRLSKGQIELTLEHGKLTESIPASFWVESKKEAKIIYSQIKNPIAAFSGKSTGELNIGFTGEGKSNQTLIIDPTADIDWGTYYGGTKQDIPNDIAIDHVGNIYVTGDTESASNIATVGSHQTTFGGSGSLVTDAFIVKFNSSGVCEWGTYYGGAHYDRGGGIITDASGNVYVGGQTTSGLASAIATPGAHQELRAGDSDAFLVKFNSSGVRQWGTYYGGEAVDNIAAIAMDATGNIYLVGSTKSFSGIATPGVHRETHGPASFDAFLVKFNSEGVREWGTYYGGENGAFANSVAVDASGNVYIAGNTSSTSGISTSGVHQVTSGGSTDAFLVKFSTTGVRQWGTYYGGTSGDDGSDVTTDIERNVYLTGSTGSSSGIANSDAHQEVFAGEQDAFLVKFTEYGERAWGTYYGGTKRERGSSVRTDAYGNIYLGGWTSGLFSEDDGSSSGIATSHAYQPNIGGWNDGFFTRFNTDGERQWGTYFGGTSNDRIYAIAVNSESIYITGFTGSTSSIATDGAHQAVFLGGGADGFVAKFSLQAGCPILSTSTIKSSAYYCAIEFNTQKPSNCLATYFWNFGDGQTSLEQNPFHAYADPGIYDVIVTINYNCPTCQGEFTLTKQVIFNPSAALEEKVIQIVTDQKLQVISTSASSFSDTWSLNYLDNVLSTRSTYLNGSQGVWRNEGTYVYKKDRKLSQATEISKDGTFTLQQFNWEYADLNAIPDWIKASSTTQYSAYGYELENKDVLDIYSGAVYDYGGQLAVATGSNMQQEEMAFTSFENIDNGVAGNWIMSTGSVPLYTEYPIRFSKANTAVVEASLEQLDNVVEVDVITTRLFSFRFRNMNTYIRSEIVCKVPHPENPLWSLVVLKTAPYEGHWFGKLRIKNVVTPVVSSELDNTIAHSGKSSMKITTDKTFKQHLLSLTPGKSYLINCWMSKNLPGLMTPVLGTNLGIDIIAKDKNNQELSTFSFSPSGPMIEGWQQVKGSFVCPVSTHYIEIRFKAGTAGTVWFDDLRLQPESGNMKTYVYDVVDNRLKAILDEENFASFFFYDVEGNLYLTKKETTDGIKTLSENISYQVER